MFARYTVWPSGRTLPVAPLAPAQPSQWLLSPLVLFCFSSFSPLLIGRLYGLSHSFISWTNIAISWDSLPRIIPHTEQFNCERSVWLKKWNPFSSGLSSYHQSWSAPGPWPSPASALFQGRDVDFALAASSCNDLWLLLLPLCISQQLPLL